MNNGIEEIKKQYVRYLNGDHRQEIDRTVAATTGVILYGGEAGDEDHLKERMIEHYAKIGAMCAKQIEYLQK